MQPVTFQFQSFRCDVVSDGVWRLDGGTLFGIVPRSLWEKIYVPDTRNRIKLGLNSLLLRDGRHTVLVETGVGPKLAEKRRARHDIGPSLLLSQLEAVGCRPRDVDVVILTHLHFDHAGCNTVLDRAGRAAPAFPRARYFIQKQEWQDAVNPTAQTGEGFIPEDFLPLEAAGQLDLVDGDVEVVPGVHVQRTGGHTAGHQSVLVRAGGRTLIYPGDILPMTAHVMPYYITAFDLYPAHTFAVKEALLARGVQEQWTVVWGHDDDHPVTGLGRREGRYCWTEIELKHVTS